MKIDTPYKQMIAFFEEKKNLFRKYSPTALLGHLWCRQRSSAHQLPLISLSPLHHVSACFSVLSNRGVGRVINRNWVSFSFLFCRLYWFDLIWFMFIFISHVYLYASFRFVGKNVNVKCRTSPASFFPAILYISRHTVNFFFCTFRFPTAFANWLESFIDAAFS